MHYMVKSEQVVLFKIMRIKDKSGKFINKSDGLRKTRSIRVTDEIWDKFGDIANQKGITRADLLEKIISDNIFLLKQDKKIFLLEEAVKLSQKLRSNSGKLIREKILNYLESQK